MITVPIVDTIVNLEAHMLGNQHASVFVTVRKMSKINQLLIKSVFLERDGWSIKFGQKCPHCGTPNTITIYNDTIVCGKCEHVFIMDDPKLQINGGRQHGSAK